MHIFEVFIWASKGTIFTSGQIPFIDPAEHLGKSLQHCRQARRIPGPV
jgi:hypothetical protein